MGCGFLPLPFKAGAGKKKTKQKNTEHLKMNFSLCLQENVTLTSPMDVNVRVPFCRIPNASDYSQCDRLICRLSPCSLTATTTPWCTTASSWSWREKTAPTQISSRTAWKRCKKSFGHRWVSATWQTLSPSVPPTAQTCSTLFVLPRLTAPWHWASTTLLGASSLPWRCLWRNSMTTEWNEPSRPPDLPSTLYRLSDTLQESHVLNYLNVFNIY